MRAKASFGVSWRALLCGRRLSEPNLFANRLPERAEAPRLGIRDEFEVTSHCEYLPNFTAGLAANHPMAVAEKASVW